jgi:hypothetical protein
MLKVLSKIPGTSGLLMLEGTHPTPTISIGGEWMETTGTYRQPYPAKEKFKPSRLSGMD